MRFDFTASNQSAAETIGISHRTLKNWRLAGKIPAYTYTQHGDKYFWCLDLLWDWHLDPNDLDAQIRAMEMIQNARTTNFARKSGRKAA
jgi:hypothetical protein